MNERMKEDAMINDGASSSQVGSHVKERSQLKRKSTLGSPGSFRDTSKPKEGNYVMNLSLISKSRNEKTTRMIMEERREMEQSTNKNPEKNLHPNGVRSMILQPVNNIDHSLFLEARVRNLGESIETFNTQIHQENNSLESLKVRRRRVKTMIMSMLTRLLRYPNEAL